MSRSQFRLSENENKSSLSITVPKGCRVHARNDAFLSCSRAVLSRVSQQRVVKNLQEFWANTGDDNVLLIAPPFTCSIEIIQRSHSDPPLILRPFVLLAAEDSLKIVKPSYWNDTIEISGAGSLALCSGGTIVCLREEKQFAQVSSSKLIALSGIQNGRKLLGASSGIGMMKCMDSMKGQVYVTNSLNSMKVLSSTAGPSGSRVKAWLQLSLQMFIVLLLLGILTIFGENLSEMLKENEWFKQMMDSAL